MTLPRLRIVPKSILAVGAHYDDIEIGCGGTLALWAKSCSITIIVVSNSAYTYAGGKRSADEARREGRAAATRLGISRITCLGYQSNYITWSADLIVRIEHEIEKCKPDLILTHFFNDTHQDHCNTTRAILSASRRYPTVWMYEPLYPSSCGATPFQPSIYVDIGKTLQRKIDALNCHKSQVKKYSERWLAAVRARAQHHGFQNGTNFAEAFQPVRLGVGL